MTKKQNDDHSDEITDGQHPYASYRDEKGRFHNNHRASKQGVMKSMGIFYRFLTEKKVNTIPEKHIPVKPLTPDLLQQLEVSFLLDARQRGVDHIPKGDLTRRLPGLPYGGALINRRQKGIGVVSWSTHHVGRLQCHEAG